MVVEVVGQQLRIRVKSPKKFISGTYRTKVLHGNKLQLIVGKNKETKKWGVQALHFNMTRYNELGLISYLGRLFDKGTISKSEYKKAVPLVKRWYVSKKEM
jgi:hypothetical protein